MPSESFGFGISVAGVAFCATPPRGVYRIPPGGGLILYKETRHGPKGLFVLIVLIRAYRSDSFVSSD